MKPKTLLCVTLLSCITLLTSGVSAASKTEHVKISDTVYNTCVRAHEAVSFSSSDSDTASALVLLHTALDTPLDTTICSTDESMTALCTSIKEKIGLGVLSLYKPETEAKICYRYEGVDGTNIGDADACDYNSYYDIHKPGQIRYISYLPDDKQVLFIRFYQEDPTIHDALRIAWNEQTKSWLIDSFDCDTIHSSAEAEIAAKFYFWDEYEAVIATESGSLNIRNAPGGEVIQKLEKGTPVTVFDHQEPAPDGTVYTLIAKYSAPDEEGYCYREYFGWASAQYLKPQTNTSKILNGGEANKRARQHWDQIIEDLKKDPSSTDPDKNSDSDKA